MLLSLITKYIYQSSVNILQAKKEKHELGEFLLMYVNAIPINQHILDQ